LCSLFYVSAKINMLSLADATDGHQLMLSGNKLTEYQTAPDALRLVISLAAREILNANG
jgi:hypothetical protein